MTSRNKRYANHGLGRGSICSRKENEVVVRSGLAYSPADIARLTDRGMPVTGINAGQMFIDGEDNPSFHITSDRRRFVDVADLWEEHMNIRDKARKAAKSKKSK